MNRMHATPFLSSEAVTLIETSMETAAGRLVPIAADFYDRLFATAPDLRDLFPESMGAQVAKLAATLNATVSALNDPDRVIPRLRRLGRYHRHMGAVAGHYPMVTDALIGALAAGLGPTWTVQTEQAWRQVLGFVGAVMLEGSRFPEHGAQTAPQGDRIVRLT